MTPELIGQFIGVILFAVVLLDCFYFLPVKIKKVKSADSGSNKFELDKYQRRLFAYRRGNVIYVFAVIWIINVVLLVMHFF